MLSATAFYFGKAKVVLLAMLAVVFYSPPKLANRITLGANRIKLRSNNTCRRRIKLSLFRLKILLINSAKRTTPIVRLF